MERRATARDRCADWASNPDYARSARAKNQETVMNAPTLHRGRLAKAPRILSVRALERDDLAVLKEKRPSQGRVRQLRETHRRLAMLVAAGFTTAQIVEVTGY